MPDQSQAALQTSDSRGGARSCVRTAAAAAHNPVFVQQTPEEQTDGCETSDPPDFQPCLPSHQFLVITRREALMLQTRPDSRSVDRDGPQQADPSDAQCFCFLLAHLDYHAGLCTRMTPIAPNGKGKQ